MMEKRSPRKRPSKNSYVLYLLLSFISVLLVPIIVIAIGITTLFYMYSQQVMQSNIDKIDHSIELIDDQLTSVTYMVSSIAKNTEVIAASEADFDTAGLRQYSAAIQALKSITRFSTPGLEDEYYVYFRKTDSVIYESTLYRAALFEQYLNEWDISRDEWYERLVPSDLSLGKFIMSESGTLQYVQPLSSGIISGDNGGAAVFVINGVKLERFFSSLVEYGEYDLYITDRKGALLYQSDSGREVDLSGTGDPFPEEKDRNVIHRASSYNGWNYYLVFPKGAIYEKMAIVYVIGLLAGVLTIFLAMMLALHRSVRIGKPIDEVFSRLDKEDVGRRDSEKFSEIVSGVLESNALLREEMEKSKPMQRKMFLHDLLSLDVVSPREIRLMAENVGVNIDYDCFCIASVSFYTNNDFIEIDEQTLSDIKVIEQALLRRLEESVGENVWCYQRNYHSRLFIFGGIQTEEVKALAEDARLWLEDVFNTESNWGVSCSCDDILNVWRCCEEAEVARERCSLKNHVLCYTAQMEDRRSIYFTESAEERIASGVRSGDFKSVKDILNIIFEENFENRAITQANLQKLNGKLTNLLASLRAEGDGTEEQIARLNEIAASPEKHAEGEYRQAVTEAFSAKCGAVNQVRNLQKSELVDGIKAYILDNWQNADLGLSMISRIFQLSEGYVSTLFKEQTGVNFVSYVENVRLEHACDLLRTTQMSVDEIGAAVGYNSVQSFRRAFKRVYNESPNEYRKTAQP